MTCKGHVQNGAIVLDEPMRLPEGTPVKIELAAGCTHIVTFNGRDFAGAERFGIKVLTPQAFLAEIGENP